MLFDRFVRGYDVGMRVFMRARSSVVEPVLAETVFGFRLRCDTRDFIQRRLAYFGIFEHNLSYYIRDVLREGDCMLDVGANIGYVSLLAAQAVGPHGTVIAIEAAPSTYRQLVANLALNDARQVRALNRAATDHACQVSIRVVDPRNIGASQVEVLDGDAGGHGGGHVEGDTISHLVGEQSMEINLVKIDIEGSEAPVLQDLADRLDAYPRLRSIVVELQEENSGFIDIFSQLGFAIYALPNNYSISYYLLRQSLARTGEGSFFSKVPVSTFDPGFTDYVFERSTTL